MILNVFRTCCHKGLQVACASVQQKQFVFKFNGLCPNFHTQSILIKFSLQVLGIFLNSSSSLIWCSKNEVATSYLYWQQHIKINLVTLEESSLFHLAFQVIPDLPSLSTHIQICYLRFSCCLPSSFETR